jgi:hypothetical protein
LRQWQWNSSASRKSIAPETERSVLLSRDHVRVFMKKTLFLSAPLSLALAFATASPALSVDFVDMAGPGQSHTNDSGISGFDGNQGNDRQVGNAGGVPLPPPPEEPAEDPVYDGGVW